MRAKLSELYSADKVSAEDSIPTHLLSNIWAQNWSYLDDLLIPDKNKESFDLAAALKATSADEIKMIKYAKAFFVSIKLAYRLIVAFNFC